MARYNRPHFDSDGDNTAQAIKASQGELIYLHVTNSNTDEEYIQLFDSLAADVTVGTTTPVLTFLVPAGSAAEPSAFEQFWGEHGIYFEKGISYACTTTATGNTDPTTGLVVNAVYG